MNLNPFFLRKTCADQAIVWIMLALLTLPSVGLTFVASQTLGGGQRTTGSEEVEERAPCNVQRRIQVDGISGASLGSQRVPIATSTCHVEPQLLPDVSGHRISNGFLAPMRC